MTLDASLAKAISRRAPLAQDPQTNAYRWVNGEADGLPALTVDRFDDVLVASLYEEKSAEEEAALTDALVRALSPRALYWKRRPREARVVATTQKAALAPERPAFGPEVPELEAKEGGLRFLIRPGQGLSVGLYLDMRRTRGWVREHARGKSVLNLFAYTCAFGVFAHAGGATRAVNVDLSRKVLDWGSANAALNGFPARKEDHLSGDSFEWLKRLAKKGEAFDLVVLDPPSFATSKQGRFSAARDYPALAAEAARVVAARGTLLCCCNLVTLEPDRFEAMAAAGIAQAGRRARVLERLTAVPLDFPQLPGSPPALKVVAFALD